ncbi:hypothetical protein CCR85_05725 [Rhodothalassium salexigens]|uniref:DMT family transporter n=1 Tax=Rhodothalassium salexigens TaxID=1086 RepID=UPI0019127323|nr:EamA family transporter [Rhodothalassium salexigens]MBK5910990.1 hypothetical protein [Rhodothalassium salexigens]
MVNALLFVACSLIWGSTWYAIEFQLGAVPQAWSVAYRFAGAGLILMGVCLARRVRLTWRPADHALFAAVGLFLFSANYLFVYLGTGYLTSGLVAVAFSALSVFNLVNGRLYLGQRISGATAAGAGAGLGGVVLLFWREVSTFSLADDTLVGLALILVAGYLASTGNTLLAAERTRRVPGLALNAWAMLYGGGAMALAALIWKGPPVIDTSPAYLLSYAYLVIAGSVLTFTMYLVLVQREGLARAGYVAVMTPLVALLISTLFEDYTWHATGFAGIALVLLGNLLIKRPTRRLRQTRNTGQSTGRENGAGGGGTTPAPLANPAAPKDRQAP